MVAEKPKDPRFGRPWKLKSPADLRNGNDKVVRSCRLFKVNLPPIDCRLSPPKDVKLVAPSATKSPVICRTLGMLMVPSVLVAMVMLPVKVVHEPSVVASPWFWI